MSFGDPDCAGILAEDTCGEALANLTKEKREAFCQKIKTQFRVTSFKDSCRAFAPYCGPENTAAQGPAGGGAPSGGASAAQPGQSAGSKGTTTPAGTPSKSGKGDSIKRAEIPMVAGSPASNTAAAMPGKPATSNTPLAATSNTPLAIDPSTTTQAAHPLKSLQLSRPGVTGGSRLQGTVELNQLPPNGLTVTLESSNTQLAQVPPSVTITQGAASAETGSIIKATFPIDTRAVLEGKSVIIKARAGVQTLQANLEIRQPVVSSAALHAPNICDGSNKGTVRYTLDGPAASGLIVHAHVTDGSGGEAVPTGDSAGSFHVSLPRCHAYYPGQRCEIHGSVRVQGAPGNPVQIYASCGPPPD